MAQNLGLARRDIANDAVFADRGSVVIGMPNIEARAVLAAWTGAVASALYASVFKGNDRIAQQRHNPIDGAREGYIAGVPAHGLLEGDFADETRQNFGQHVASRFAYLLLTPIHVAGIALFFHDQVFGVDPKAFGKADGCRGWVAVSVEGNLCARTFHQFIQRALLGRDISDECRNTTRRGKHRNRAMLNSLGGKRVVNQFAQLLLRGRHIVGGELFDT